jgi:hypothetical protein
MNTLVAICQVVVALGLLNVWLLRFSRSTAYRGGAAANMREEFAAYGLPAWSCAVVGVLKVGAAACLLAGLAYPPLVLPAAIVVAVLMLGAIAMHLRIGDPPRKSLPAVAVLVLTLVICAGHLPA